MSYKQTANEVILRNAKEKGFPYALDLCSKIIASEHMKKVPSSIEDRNTVVGEICETVLEMTIQEFMRVNKSRTSEWFYTKGLILKDAEKPDSEYLTEIDLVLFTPQKVFLFECKSYSGDKRVIRQGTIVRKGRKDFDVFRQHIGHAETFIKTFDGFRDQSFSEDDCYQLAAFSFATGSVNDQRIDKWKKVMPFIGVTEVIKLFSSVSGESVWNIRYAKEAVRIIEKKKDSYTAKHLEYVRGLRSRK